jgi:tryptophan synthase alpha chain
MSAIDDIFRQLRADSRRALVPFLTAGDPDLDFTREAIVELAARGGTLVEIGFPYSDPIADGPVIQASYTRALARGVTVDGILSALPGIAREAAVPLVGMVSYAIVHRRGPPRFVSQARGAGLAGLIVPDLPAEESAELSALCRTSEMSLVQLVTPTTSRQRALAIAQASTGFLYYVSVAGITGERHELPPRLVDDVAWLRERTILPILVGFGVSRPEQARLLSQVADGVIVGSALVRKLALVTPHNRPEVLRDIGDLAAALRQAL